jgi:hypothetical protein
MESALPPIKERVLVLRHATLDAEAFGNGLALWNKSVEGQLTHQGQPRAQWHIDIPARADGAPEIDKISVKCNLTHQYWNKTGSVARCCVQMRPEFLAFNLVSGEDSVGSFKEMTEFTKTFLPLWEQSFSVKTFSEIQLQYLNVFGPMHLRPFTENDKIIIGRVIKIFIQAFNNVTFAIPYRHEFTLNWMARPVPCYLDVALSLPKKKETELDLNITARTGENLGKITVMDCLDKIVPALHDDVSEVFNAILTDEALNHCGVKK